MAHENGIVERIKKRLRTDELIFDNKFAFYPNLFGPYNLYSLFDTHTITDKQVYLDVANFNLKK